MGVGSARAIPNTECLNSRRRDIDEEGHKHGMSTGLDLSFVDLFFFFFCSSNLVYFALQASAYIALLFLLHGATPPVI